MNRNHESQEPIDGVESFGVDQHIIDVLKEIRQPHELYTKFRHKREALSAHFEAEVMHPLRHIKLVTTIGAGAVAASAIAVHRHRS